jgi:hypothetical protein
MVMQIKELEISHKLKRSLGGSDLANMLHQLGWKPLGHGFEAGVAQHPLKPYVIKIFPKNSPYVHFVNMVQSHPKNPHFPTFFSRQQQDPNADDKEILDLDDPNFPNYKRYVRPLPGTQYSYVRMEKLRKMLPYDLTQFPSLLCLLDEMWFTHAPHEQPPYWVRSSVTWDAHTADSTGVMDCNQEVINPQETQAIHTLSNTLKQIGWSHVDLHHGNFMMRGNTWVITDPFI